MNGAESLVKTLALNGVEVCFTNPGTSEMHFMAALDRTNALRCVLGLQENVVTGAADGYARMAGKPAATLLHLGPGLANGLANLHNAKKAGTGIVNIVGDHATYHIEYDAPLTSDVEGVARPMSDWVKTSPTAEGVAADGAEAVRQASTHPGQVATLILPANTAWGEGSAPVQAGTPNTPAGPSAADVEAAAKALSDAGENGALYLKGNVLREPGLTLAGKIAAKTGARLLAPTSNARIDRGAGRVPVERVPYVVAQALDRLSSVKQLVGIGENEPVAFFAYPDKPSQMLPDSCARLQLTGADEDGTRALEMLCEALDAQNAAPAFAERRTDGGLPDGTLDSDKIAAVVSAMLPENAIVIDESVSSGRQLNWQTAGAAPHSWLHLCGGAIGAGIPLAVGAAIACPDRKVVALQADGSSMYTIQGLWTQAREGLDVTTVIYANRAYAILQGEMAAVGVENPGKVAQDMFGLDRPTLDFVSLARGMGVEGERVDDAGDFQAALQRGLATPGPYLIEAVI
ncbi:MAG: acetolactate synthase large subunit [Rhodospirillaceae bacterium]|nr:acetolactate synthase large subunit [Rhodospirillaceae bacterium]